MELLDEFENKLKEAKSLGKRYFELPYDKDIFTHDKCMECVIKIAMLSGSDDKDDEEFLGVNIPQPKIGALLINGNKIYFSARSGMKNGDHAEFTILQTMTSQINIDNNAILYTTLEPCTQVSRSPWTESCSNLIVNRKIKKVFVGTLDKNPLVLGAGIHHLTKHGVDVQFFDKKYQEQLEEINKDFFKFCESFPDIKLLKKVHRAIGEHLDYFAIKKYLEKEDIDFNDIVSFYRRMINNHQILKGELNETITVTNDFALVFFTNPNTFLCGYNIGIINNVDKEMFRKDYTFNIPTLVCHEKENIFKKIACQYDKEISINDDIKIEKIYKIINKKFGKNKLREALINSLVHNDYTNPSITIILQKDCVEIINKIPNAIDIDLYVDDLNSTQMTTIPLNPCLMEFLKKCHICENTNLGMETLRAHNNSNIYSAIKNHHCIKTTIRVEK